MTPFAMLFLLAPIPPIDAPVLDMCAIGAADASTTLGVKNSVKLDSGTSAYAAAGCKRFVADFVVQSSAHPSSASLDRRFRLSGMPTSSSWEASKGACEGLKLAVKVYRKGVGATSFSSVSSATYKGAWTETTQTTFGGCYLVKTGTEPGDKLPNKLGTETWRLSVDAKLYDNVIPVSAKLEFMPKPPE